MKLPIVSGKDLLKALTKICFREVSARGSHRTLKRIGKITMPMHPEISKTTLKRVLSKIESDEKIPEIDMRKLLRGEPIPAVHKKIS